MTRPCRKCGCEKRYKNGKCVECHKARELARSRANPENNRARVAQWQKDNPEKYAASRTAYTYKNRANKKRYDQQYNATNKARKQAQGKLWNKNNPALKRAYSAKRRAARLNATPDWAIQFIIREAYALSRLRTKLTGVSWHVDHIVPLVNPIVCGLHTHDNLQVISAVANIAKGNQVWPDMP